MRHVYYPKPNRNKTNPTGYPFNAYTGRTFHLVEILKYPEINLKVKLIASQIRLTLKCMLMLRTGIIFSFSVYTYTTKVQSISIAQMSLVDIKSQILRTCFYIFLIKLYCQKD